MPCRHLLSSPHDCVAAFVSHSICLHWLPTPLAASIIRSCMLLSVERLDVCFVFCAYCSACLCLESCTTHLIFSSAEQTQVLPLPPCLLSHFVLAFLPSVSYVSPSVVPPYLVRRVGFLIRSFLVLIRWSMFIPIFSCPFLDLRFLFLIFSHFPILMFSFSPYESLLVLSSSVAYVYASRGQYSLFAPFFVSLILAWSVILFYHRSTSCSLLLCLLLFMLP